MHEQSLQSFFVLLGLSISIKIAIFPQIIPFIVKDELKIDSAHAYNQSLEHLFSACTLLSIGIYSNEHPEQTYPFALWLFIALTGLSTIYYIKLYRFDKQKKASMLDLQVLGERKSYIDFSRQKLLGTNIITPVGNSRRFSLMGGNSTNKDLRMTGGATQPNDFSDNLNRLQDPVSARTGGLTGKSQKRTSFKGLEYQQPYTARARQAMEPIKEEDDNIQASERLTTETEMQRLKLFK